MELRIIRLNVVSLTPSIHAINTLVMEKNKTFLFFSITIKSIIHLSILAYMSYAILMYKAKTVCQYHAKFL